MRTEEQNTQLAKEFMKHCAMFLGSHRVDLLASVPIVITVMVDLLESAIMQMEKAIKESDEYKNNEDGVVDKLAEMMTSIRMAISIELDMIEQRMKETI
jgi:hypothetical protein